MSFYERRLPHWHPAGRDLFLTWRLQGSLPPNRYVPPKGLTSGQAFVWIDRYLDQTRTGPRWSERAEIAQMIVDAIHHGQDKLHHYKWHAYVVMANHVHLLISPLAAPPKIMQSPKGFTAREANKMLDRMGQVFWQAETYDHWVRDAREFDKIRGYIEDNPVKAGLVALAEDYLWSIARKKPGREAGLQPGLAAPQC